MLGVKRKLKKRGRERMGGNEEGEMSWKKANIENGRKTIGGEDQWKEINRKNI